MKIKFNQRGFAWLSFKDRYKQECILQKSSLVSEDCIWFGIDRGIPKGPGLKGEEINGRMHLTRKQVRALLPHLQRFVETGELNEE